MHKLHMVDTLPKEQVGDWTLPDRVISNLKDLLFQRVSRLFKAMERLPVGGVEDGQKVSLLAVRRVSFLMVTFPCVLLSLRNWCSQWARRKA